jgi:hypothetical protein
VRDAARDRQPAKQGKVRQIDERRGLRPVERG